MVKESEENKMAQENVNELQKLSLDEMDSVAGGTWKEVAELIQAFNSNPKMVKARVKGEDSLGEASDA